MKHLRPISSGQMAKAATWQDIACTIINFFGTIIESIGGSSPFLNVVLDKCDPTT